MSSYGQLDGQAQLKQIQIPVYTRENKYSLHYRRGKRFTPHHQPETYLHPDFAYG